MIIRICLKQAAAGQGVVAVHLSREGPARALWAACANKSRYVIREIEGVDDHSRAHVSQPAYESLPPDLGVEFFSVSVSEFKTRTVRR